MTTYFIILAWEIPWKRGAWWATVHGVVESDMTKQLSSNIDEKIKTVTCLRLFNRTSYFRKV